MLKIKKKCKIFSLKEQVSRHQREFLATKDDFRHQREKSQKNEKNREKSHENHNNTKDTKISKEKGMSLAHSFVYVINYER